MESQNYFSCCFVLFYFIDTKLKPRHKASFKILALNGFGISNRGALGLILTYPAFSLKL